MTAIENRLTRAFQLEAQISELSAHKECWARSSVAERIKVLNEIKDNTLAVSKEWVIKACLNKKIPFNSPSSGEEWLSGPYALLAACNGLIKTLTQLKKKSFLQELPSRVTSSGQLAVNVVPHNVWDHLLLNGVKAEIWMQPDTNQPNLYNNTASSYDVTEENRLGSVSLVLGAGNISAISPLDCLHKLFFEHSVVILKMNPVNQYLQDILILALQPLIRRGALRIVSGGADVGSWLCNHPEIEDIHITGAQTTHDTIVWGTGSQGEINRQNNTPINQRRITSELGGVSPVIVLPGKWTSADIKFQAEQIVSQKLHNTGCNCVAAQVLVVPKRWKQLPEFIQALKCAMRSAPVREAYYPGYSQRVDGIVALHKSAEKIVTEGNPCYLIDLNETKNETTFYEEEVFSSVLGYVSIDSESTLDYVKSAISFSNIRLAGSLGGNIIVDPCTRKTLDKDWDALIASFRYGTIAINTWTGLAFLTPLCSWGAFPGQDLSDVGSGIGVVHNTFMFDSAERTVIEAPFRPFPRTLRHGAFSLLPHPPWSIFNRKAHILGRLLTEFQHSPSYMKLPKIFATALRG